MRSMSLFSNINWTKMAVLVAVAMCLSLVLEIPVAAAQSEFRAEGPTEPVKLPPRQKGAVTVTFDLIPTTMSFNLPAFPSMVTENGISYSNFWAETYDPRHWHYGGGLASFEPLMDRQNRYARMWIEHQSDARIVVRSIARNEKERQIQTERLKAMLSEVRIDADTEIIGMPGGKTIADVIHEFRKIREKYVLVVDDRFRLFKPNSDAQPD